MLPTGAFPSVINLASGIRWQRSVKQNPSQTGKTLAALPGCPQQTGPDVPASERSVETQVTCIGASTRAARGSDNIGKNLENIPRSQEALQLPPDCAHVSASGRLLVHNRPPRLLPTSATGAKKDFENVQNAHVTERLARCRHVLH